MVWGALIGAGLSAAGGLMADNSANKANKANIADIKGLFGKQYGAAWSQLLKGLDATNQSYGAAKNAAAVAGENAEKGILETGAQNAAAIKADLVGKGLGNTTAVGNAANQSAAMTQGALSAQGEKTAALNASIEQNHAQALNANYAALANLATWKADSLGGILGGIQHQSGGGGLWNMAGDIAGGLDWGDMDWGKW